MISFIVHGGAWDIPDDLVEAHRNGVRQALAIGWNILTNGGSAVEAVEKSVNVMEDDPTFDAGRGSFVNSIGEIELDASIMDGTTFRAGAIAAVQNIRNPISLARVIMDKSEHILLAGRGAVRFAEEHGITQCSKEDLLVGRELERWKEIQRSTKSISTKDAFRKKMPHDTVGAVAVDRNGVIASGTSTGGTPNQYPGESEIRLSSDAELTRIALLAAHRARDGGRRSSRSSSQKRLLISWNTTAATLRLPRSGQSFN